MNVMAQLREYLCLTQERYDGLSKDILNEYRGVVCLIKHRRAQEIPSPHRRLVQYNIMTRAFFQDSPIPHFRPFSPLSLVQSEYLLHAALHSASTVGFDQHNLPHAGVRLTLGHCIGQRWMSGRIAIPMS